MMKTRNYYRPSTVVLRKNKRVARRKSGTRFFLKFFILLALAAGVVWGGWCGISTVYRLAVEARVSDWHVKTVVVEGVSGDLHKKLTALAAPYQHKPFTIQEAVALRRTVIKQYTMLKDVSVKRGLISGKLTLHAVHRTPLAKFVRPDGSTEYIDADSTVYADPHPNVLTPVPSVELEGQVPEKLSTEFIDLVESTLKLNKELNFAFLRMNLTENTVKMYLPDESMIDFGPAEQLKKKAARAAQIVALARQKYKAPFVLNFQFFQNGKVFLTQAAH